jgi:hypothetical protein
MRGLVGLQLPGRCCVWPWRVMGWASRPLAPPRSPPPPPPAALPRWRARRGAPAGSGAAGRHGTGTASQRSHLRTGHGSAGAASRWRAPAGRWAARPLLPAPRGGGTRARTAEAPVPPPSAPQGARRCGASAKTRSPHEAVSAAIGCVSRQRRYSVALACRSASAGLPAHCWGSWGRCPQTPWRRSPSRVGVGGKVEGSHCGAVQGRRAARGSLA